MHVIQIRKEVDSPAQADPVKLMPPPPSTSSVAPSVPPSAPPSVYPSVLPVQPTLLSKQVTPRMAGPGPRPVVPAVGLVTPAMCSAPGPAPAAAVPTQQMLERVSACASLGDKEIFVRFPIQQFLR